MSDDSARRAEEVARRSHGKLVALLAARTRDIAAAEDALADAFVSALVDWPKSGCPKNPEAWLLTVARRKWLDSGRRSSRREAATPHLALLAEEAEAAESGAAIPDRRLALMFACAHPGVEENARTPLILQVVLGLDAKAIASAFLTSPAAMGKRLTRRRPRYATRASRSAYLTAMNSRLGWKRFWPRCTPRSLRAGRTRSGLIPRARN